MSDTMKTKFLHLNTKLFNARRPHPTSLPYTTSPLVTTPQTTKEVYHYVTPFIKYYTLPQHNCFDLFIITSSNRIAIHGFTDPIIDVQLFKLQRKIEKIEYALLTVTKNQMVIYGVGIVDNEFAIVNLDIAVYVGDDIKKVAICEGVVIFCTDSSMYQFRYMTGFLKTSYVYQHKGIKEYIMSLFRSESNYVKDIAISKKYAAVLREKNIEIYKVNGSLSCINKVETRTVDAVYFYSDEIFFTVDSLGNRIFYNEKGKLLDVSAPQSFTYYDGKTKIHSDGDTLVIVKNKKNEKNSIVLVVVQNEYYKKNEPNKENYQTFTVYDEIESIQIFDAHIILKSVDNTHKLSITSPGQYFLKVKHAELTALHKLYGTNDFLLHYLFLIEEGLDVSKLDFLFLKADDYDFIYEYLFRRLAEIDVVKTEMATREGEMYTEDFMSPCFDDYVLRLCKTINAFKVVYAKLRRYRKDDCRAVIDDFKAVLDTLTFLKIIKERRISLACDFEVLLLNKQYRKTILEELSQSMPYDRINLIVTQTLKDYFPIEEIYFRKGMENVKKRRRDTLFDSINDFKECSNLDEIVRIYNEAKFYTGSVTIIKDKMFGHEELQGVKRRKTEGRRANTDLSKVTKALRLSIRCRGALNKALEDYREEFVFCVLEAVLKNVVAGVEYKDKCACCDRDSGRLEFSGPLAVARLDTPYVKKFLELKFEFSNVEAEYNLYWKYFILKNEKDKAKELLMRVIREKPITLEQRIKCLEKSIVLFQGNEIRTMLSVAKIQRELSQSMPECLHLKIQLLDHNELFNDWLYDQSPFLALKLMMVCKCNDLDAKAELFTSLLSGDYDEASEKVAFYNELNKKGWVELEIIGDIILKKLELVQRTNVMHVLKSFNYEEVVIKKYMERRIKDSVFDNPEQKRRILREYKDYYGYCEKTAEFETFCFKNYGVKV